MVLNSATINFCEALGVAISSDSREYYATQIPAGKSEEVINVIKVLYPDHAVDREGGWIRPWEGYDSVVWDNSSGAPNWVLDVEVLNELLSGEGDE